MDEKEIIKAAMLARGYNQEMVAKKVGYKRQSNISEILRSSHMRMDNFFKILDALDFDIIVKDRNGKNSDNVWKVEIE